MAAEDHLNGYQFHYHSPDMGISMHRVEALKDDTTVGVLEWNRRHVTSLAVRPEHQRQGIATQMWKHANAAANTYQKVPRPKHSSDRTDAGDAWARKIGGPLPHRVRYTGEIGEWGPA